jgi:hypothetical protein
LKPSTWSWGNDGKKERDNARASSSQPEQGDGESSANGSTQADEGESSAGQAGESQAPQASDGGSGKQAQGEQGNAQQGASSGSSSSQGGDSGSGESASQKKQQGEKKTSQQQRPDKSGAQQQQAKRSADSKSSSAQQRQSAQESGNASAANQTPRSPLSVSSLFGWLGTLFKLIVWTVLLAVIVYNGWKHRDQLIAAWQKLLAELRMLWERYFGTRSSTPSNSELPLPPPVTQIAFSDFQNPFISGRARTMTPRELLHYTFQALEAYGREVGCPRTEQETPHEFGERLVVYAPSLATDVQRVLDVYGYAAYAGGRLPASAMQPLQAIWQTWSREACAPVAKS